MKIVNYQRETVARQLDLLHKSLETENRNVNEKNRIDAQNRLIASGVLNLLAVAAVIMLMCIDMARLGVIITSAFILAVLAGSVSLIVISILYRPKNISSWERKTFAMKFYEIEQMGKLVEVSSDEKKTSVKLLYEDNENYIHEKILKPYKTVKSTSITEERLDIGRGYLLLPYTYENIVTFEEPVVEHVVPDPDKL